MPFLLRNLTLHPDSDESSLCELAAAQLGLAPTDLLEFRIRHKGVDARKKTKVLLVYTVSFSLADERRLIQKLGQLANLEQIAVEPTFPVSTERRMKPVVIVGMGPAGLFCALRLVAHGITTTLIERGKPVAERVQDVAGFWRDGLLNPESNVQFGEGGAGTFSDGKLTCRLRDPNTGWVLEDRKSVVWERV